MSDSIDKNRTTQCSDYGKTENNHNTPKNKAKQILILVVLCCFPLLLLVSCRSGNYLTCSKCGDDRTRLFVAAFSSNDQGDKYRSCVGPAGVVGCGLNTRCWPTECVSVKISDGNDSKFTGCVTYYNDFGCIDKSKVKSYGKYTNYVSCGGQKCTGYEYREAVGETTKAKQRDMYFGCKAKEWEEVESNHYNEFIPRSFTKGCWKPDK